MARGRHAKTIDTVHWTGAAASAFAQTAGSIGFQALPAQHLPETLLRIRGEWVSWIDGVQSPTGAVQITAGVILVPEGTGTTVLWDPSGDADAPWIWWDTMVLSYEEMVTDVIDVPGMTSGRRVVDSKAMRKVRNRELQFVVTNFTLDAALPVNTVFRARVLSGS